MKTTTRRRLRKRTFVLGNRLFSLLEGGPRHLSWQPPDALVRTGDYGAIPTGYPKRLSAAFSIALAKAFWVSREWVHGSGRVELPTVSCTVYTRV